MPRKARSSSDQGGALAELKAAIGLDDRPREMNGYEVEGVCLPCLSMLQGECCCSPE
jgi:hypothetical protein